MQAFQETQLIKLITQGIYSSLVAIAISGCVPDIGRYTKVYAPKATYSGVGCARDYSEPVQAEFMRGNIAHMIAIDPKMGYAPYLKILYPTGTEIFLIDKSIVVTSNLADGEVELPLHMGRSYHTVAQLDDNGKITGGLDVNFKPGHTLLRFDFSKHAAFENSGKIRLPALRVNGENIEPITLKFGRATHVGISPLNC